MTEKEDEQSVDTAILRELISKNEDRATALMERNYRLEKRNFILSIFLGAAIVIWPMVQFYLAQKQAQVSATVQLASGFSQPHILEAAFAQVGALSDLENGDSFLDILSRIAPLSRHLDTIALCMDTKTCDRNLMPEVFCDRAIDFSQRQQVLFRAANADWPGHLEHFQEMLNDCTS